MRPICLGNPTRFECPKREREGGRDAGHMVGVNKRRFIFILVTSSYVKLEHV
jgi:hypothetical protein